MSLTSGTTLPVDLCFPRVSGDEPAPRREPKGLIEFSPRERG